MCYILKRHLRRKNYCDPILNDVPLKNQLIQIENEENEARNFKCKFCDKTFTASSNMYRHQKTCNNVSEEAVPRPRTQIQNQHRINNDLSNIHRKLLKQDSKRESYYQIILEYLLRGTHKKLEIGITDITTDQFHAEIKQWDYWMKAIGQLCSYNVFDKKQELRVYFFGNYNNKAKVIQVFREMNIKCFECVDQNDQIQVVDLETNEILFLFKLP
jgi:hypothetical protein